MFPQELFLKGITRMNLNPDINQEKIEQLNQFFELLEEWNESINLTRITDPEEVVIKHYLDSFAPIKYLPFKRGERVCDVGAGAGFPGIPLKVLRPEIHLTLVESQKKRASFLRAVIKELGLEDTEVLQVRAEELGQNKKYREVYEKVLARAVAPLRALLELSLPLTASGGVFIAYKGPRAWQEIKESDRALEILGGKVEKVEQVEIPFQKEKRILVIIKKISRTPDKYPRRTGVPEKKPL